MPSLVVSWVLQNKLKHYEIKILKHYVKLKDGVNIFIIVYVV